jgi:hypothetical protein
VPELLDAVLELELVDVELELAVVVELELAVVVLEELELDVLQGPHSPSALPTGTMQVSPGQQSALTVHLPQLGTHETCEQMYGGVPPSTGFGTQGRLLQQLALVAQEPPAGTHATAAQRGTPSVSGLQVSWVSQLPAQQSHDALQLIVCSLQTSPSGLQLCGFLHTPTVFGAVMLHVTGFWGL